MTEPHVLPSVQGLIIVETKDMWTRLHLIKIEEYI